MSIHLDEVRECILHSSAIIQLLSFSKDFNPLPLFARRTSSRKRANHISPADEVRNKKENGDFRNSARDVILQKQLPRYLRSSPKLPYAQRSCCQNSACIAVYHIRPHSHYTSRSHNAHSGAPISSNDIVSDPADFPP
jgi:hypothetical protein